MLIGNDIRPRLKVWAHREDLDREQLAKDLEERFSQQVARFRTRKKAAVDSNAHAIVKESKAKTLALKKDEDHPDELTFATMASAAAVGIFLFTNPLFDLFLLLLAVTSGTEAVRGLWNRAESQVAESRGIKATKDAKVEGEAIRKEAAEKKKAFRTALDGLEIRVHVQLSQLGSDYASVDGVPWMGGEGVEGPSVIKVLRDSHYLGRLPNWYHPLLESRIEQWDKV